MVEQEHWLGKTLFGVTILTGSFLLFFVQPLAGKIVTLQFGGIATIWSVCLLFFQVTLLAGYTLTYGLSRLAPRLQGIAYAGLMGLSFFLVAIPERSAWHPMAPDEPVVSLIVLLAKYLALGTVLLSAISGLMQNWYRLSGLGNPYPLYSISNIGSFGALLLYPLLLEPNLTIGQTSALWTTGYRLLVLLVILCAGWLSWRVNHNPANGDKQKEATAASDEIAAAAPTGMQWVSWIGLSALGSVLLLGMTNHITHNITPMPLLWVIPLSLYLLTFILCFSSFPFYRRSLTVGLAQIFLVLFLYLYQTPVNILVAIGTSLTVLFLLCMVCHGEIVRSKPAARYLPEFYLAIALGGALGGGLVSLAAPVIFSGYLELPLALAAGAVLTLYLTWRHRLAFLNNRALQRGLLGLLIFATGFYGLGHWAFSRDRQLEEFLAETRNFYGVASVRLQKENHFKGFYNGAILHGGQYFQNAAARRIPLAYYSNQSGLAVVMEQLRQRRGTQPLRIGAVGLGAGALAAYGRQGDRIAFYEIDPKMTEMAKRHFTYLSDSPAKIDILMGDARRTLESQPPQRFDLLLVDAFSGDAIPMHLLSVEAMTLYQRHIQPDGIILMHVTNRYLDLNPAINNLAAARNLHVRNLYAKPTEPYKFYTRYIALSPAGWLNQAIDTDLKRHPKQYANITVAASQANPRQGLWTDDFSNLIQSFYFDAKQ